ncbi:small acid-soluble spore protein H [Halobacillus yeomjeoni]|uniref:small acid-soluble spore protein H n=1 Tax=Halobacillus yeomjeoni TaxID=311194 RepID=UPI001CD23DC6|nr:small acid-soluble spore protein H [Halobacillus yeomjeoni]MCA0982897.1 small acid-soluble spore protein H [Halobacillus yeomjeoni]
MNKNRAQEICTSPKMANVVFNGQPIYIQNVDEQNGTARIYPLGQPEREQTVSLNELEEQ